MLISKFNLRDKLNVVNVMVKDQLFQIMFKDVHNAMEMVSLFIQSKEETWLHKDKFIAQDVKVREKLLLTNQKCAKNVVVVR